MSAPLDIFSTAPRSDGPARGARGADAPSDPLDVFAAMIANDFAAMIANDAETASVEGKSSPPTPRAANADPATHLRQPASSISVVTDAPFSEALAADGAAAPASPEPDARAPTAEPPSAAAPDEMSPLSGASSRLSADGPVPEISLRGPPERRSFDATAFWTPTPSAPAPETPRPDAPIGGAASAATLAPDAPVSGATEPASPTTAASAIRRREAHAPGAREEARAATPDPAGAPLSVDARTPAAPAFTESVAGRRLLRHDSETGAETGEGSTPVAAPLPALLGAGDVPVAANAEADVATAADMLRADGALARPADRSSAESDVASASTSPASTLGVAESAEAADGAPPRARGAPQAPAPAPAVGGEARSDVASASTSPASTLGVAESAEAADGAPPGVRGAPHAPAPAVGGEARSETAVATAPSSAPPAAAAADPARAGVAASRAPTPDERTAVLSSGADERARARSDRADTLATSDSQALRIETRPPAASTAATRAAGPPAAVTPAEALDAAAREASGRDETVRASPDARATQLRESATVDHARAVAPETARAELVRPAARVPAAQAAAQAAASDEAAPFAPMSGEAPTRAETPPPLVPTAPAAEPAGLAAARAISEAVALSSDRGRVELRLDPQELGKVGIDIAMDDTRVSATITAERPETMDLLRRHADALQRELLAAGFERAELNFGDRPKGGRDGAAASPGAAPAEAEPERPAITPAARFARPMAIGDRLDIRL